MTTDFGSAITVRIAANDKHMFSAVASHVPIKEGAQRFGKGGTCRAAKGPRYCPLRMFISRPTRAKL